MKHPPQPYSPRLLTCASSLLPILALPAFGATYPAAVQQDKPAGYYRFSDSAARPQLNANSGSLGAAGNATNINVHAIAGGAVVGGHDAAAYFDSTARAIIPWNAELNPDASQSFTIEAWFCPTSDKVAGTFVGPAPIMNRYSGSVANRQGWVYFQRNPDSRPYNNGQTDVGWNFRMYKGSGSSVGVQITSGKPYKIGVWQHVVTVWDTTHPEGNYLIMYIDGEEAVRSGPIDPGNVVYSANTDDHGDEQAKNGPAGLCIGSYNNTEAGSNPFRGGVDEVAFYKKALTPEQIKAHYDNAQNSQRAVAYEGLVQSDGPVGYWRLDDPSVGPDVAVNMGLLQSGGHGANTAEVQHPVAGGLVGASDTAYTYHWRNGSATTDLPYNAAMNPDATLPFTVEAWFRPTVDRQSVGACPINNRYVKSGNRTGWVFFQRAPNASYAGVGGNEGIGWNFRLYTGQGGSGKDVVSSVPYTVGEWQHVVATWSGGERADGAINVTGTASIYINGVLAASNPNVTYAENSAAPDVGDPADFAIGSYNAASGLGSNPFEGGIDEVAFYNVQLSPDQIAAHYAAGIDSKGSAEYANLVLTAPYEVVSAAYEADPSLPKPAHALQPVSYFRLDDKAASPVANSGVAGDAADGAVVIAHAAVAGPQGPGYPGFEPDNAAFAAAAKSFVSLDNPPVLNLAGALTLEAWINPDATQVDGARIVSHGPPTLSFYAPDATREGAILAGNEVYLRIERNGSDSLYAFGTADGTDTHAVTTPVPEGDLGSGSWVHLVGTYNGTSWSLYRNGVLLDSVADPVGPLAVDNAGWAIGAKGNGWDGAYSGFVDEVALYDHALTAAQVAAHYAAATGTGASHLSISRAGGAVTLTWTGGILQESSSVTGTFKDVAGAASPLTVTAPTETRFYRLR
ncbi:MAG TPA: hypothetical protein DCM86_01690 [Verrucomicrobiales bacterium]|nr:hypothetical protein [Verrucomicrobiales bacterium]